MRKIVEELIELRLSARDKEECPYSHTPNKRLLKSIKDVEAKKGLKKFKNAEDLFKKLGI